MHTILDNVVNGLLGDADKRFVWAEISFFSLWWEQQNDERRQQVRDLAASGQLEFVEGGWVQADEGAAHPLSIMNQITAGHEYLLKNVGVRPRIGWQIDPFGHSSSTPTLFSRIGFDAMVINRIHFSLKDRLKRDADMEFMWRPSHSLGSNAEIYTHVLHTHYSAPKGFDFEEGWNSVKVNSGNLRQRAGLLATELKNRARAYKSSHLLVPFGDDFKFRNSAVQWSNMDQVVKHINEEGTYGITIRYSTVSEYFAAVAKEQTAVNVITGDFFPYADNADAYWTGYFTSRPVTKGLIRSTEAQVRTADLLYAMARAANDGAQSSDVWATAIHKLVAARQDLALTQHHDAVTGTSRKLVDDDYQRRLRDGTRAAGEVAAQAAELLLLKPAGSKTPPQLIVPPELGMNLANDKCLPVVVANSLGWSRTELVRVVTASSNVHVEDASGRAVKHQIDPVWEQSSGDANGGRPASNKFSVAFLAKLGPAGVSTFFICSPSAPVPGLKLASIAVAQRSSGLGGGLRGAGGAQSGVFNVDARPFGDLELVLENGVYKMTFSRIDGRLESLENKVAKQSISIEHGLFDYKTSKSGAYIFRPLNAPARVEETATFVRVTKGDAYQELLYRGGSVTRRYRLLEGDADDVLTNVVVQVDMDQVSALGDHEIVTRFHTNMNNANVFYTDNGWEMRRRQRQKLIAGSYYPCISSAALRDERSGMQLSVFNDRSRGATSLDPGDLEFMLHRHLLKDDGRGLAQPNQDSSVIDTRMALMLAPTAQSLRLRARGALAHSHPPTVFLAYVSQDKNKWTSDYRTSASLLAADGLPHNVHLLSVEARDGNADDVAFRLMNIDEVPETAPAMSGRAVQFGLHDALDHYSVSDVRERKLSLHLGKNDAPMYRYKSTNKVLRLEFDPAAAVIDTSAVNQNTDEAGVFISAAALENAGTAGARTLLALSPGADQLAVSLFPMDIRAWTVRLDASDHVGVQPRVSTSNAREGETKSRTVSWPAAPAPMASPTKHGVIDMRPNAAQEDAERAKRARDEAAARPARAADGASGHGAVDKQPARAAQEVTHAEVFGMSPVPAVVPHGHHTDVGHSEFIFILLISLAGVGLMLFALYRVGSPVPRRSDVSLYASGPGTPGLKKH